MSKIKILIRIALVMIFGVAILYAQWQSTGPDLRSQVNLSIPSSEILSRGEGENPPEGGGESNSSSSEFIEDIPSPTETPAEDGTEPSPSPTVSIPPDLAGAASLGPPIPSLGDKETDQTKRQVERKGNFIVDHTLRGRRKGQRRKDRILVKIEGEKKHHRLRLKAGESVEEGIVRFETSMQRRGYKVAIAEQDTIARASYTPNDPYFRYQWNMDSENRQGGIRAQNAWDVSQGDNVVVAVLDTGVAYENFSSGGRSFVRAPDLADTCFVPGFDFVNNDNHPNDDNNHGTHVAGTIAQSTNNKLGVAGVAFKACIMPVKVIDEGGIATHADIADGIYFAVDNGAKIINLSLGSPVGSRTMEAALSYARSKGVTVVASSGNENAGVSFPAAYNRYVIAVGATRYDETRAPYSNFGSSLDLAAPGGDTSVDQNEDGFGDGIVQNTFEASSGTFGYYFFQGTSMAAPHVAGVAALLLEKKPSLTPEEIQSILQDTAKDLGPSGRDDTYGFGLVNAAAALQVVAPTPVPTRTPTPRPATPTPTRPPSPTPSPTRPPTPTPTRSPTPTPSPTQTSSPTPIPTPSSTPSFQQVVEVFSDNFEVAEWNNLWTEDAQNRWSRATELARGGTTSARVNGPASDATLTSAPINLQGRRNAQISFSWFIGSGLDLGEYILFEVSTDGGATWIPRTALRGNLDPEDAWRSVSLTLTNIQSLRLRFKGRMTLQSERGYVDLVKVLAF